jgi:hypothetical protein
MEWIKEAKNLGRIAVNDKKSLNIRKLGVKKNIWLKNLKY